MNEQNTAREWLEFEYKRRRTRNPRYSLRMMAKQLQIPPGRLSEILRGKRSISQKLAEKIAERLSLPPDQRSKFIFAIEKERKIHGAYVGPKYKQLTMDSYNLIADWYHFAILNVLNLSHFRSEPKWIAQRLGISVIEANSALDRLKRLDLIEDVNGNLRMTETHLTTTHDVDSVALRTSHKQKLKQAIEALDETPVHERDVTSIMMAIDTSKLPQAKEMIKQFRRNLCSLLEDNPTRNEVYNLNIQLVPVTKRDNKDG